MSLTQSVFSDTLRRFESSEFFFFSVRLFVLLGVSNSDEVHPSLAMLGTMAVALGDSFTPGGVTVDRDAGTGGSELGVTVAAITLTLALAAPRSAGFGGVDTSAPSPIGVVG